MIKHKKIFCLFSSFLLLSLISTTAISISVEDENDKSLYVNMGPEIDLKLRKPNGEWQDDSISESINNKLDVKIDPSISSGKVLIVVLIPYSNGEPMLSFVVGSSSNAPFFVSDEVILWGYAGSIPDKIEFQLKVIKAGQGDLESSVADVDTEETGSDSVSVTTTGKAKYIFRILELLEIFKIRFSMLIKAIMKNI